MCESRVYLRKNNSVELIAEDIVSITPKENGFKLIDISGKVYEVNDVVIEYIDFVNHRVILREIDQ